MAELDFTFNPDTVEDRQFSVFPIGEYIGAVTESDYLATKNGKGKYIKLVFTILEGPLAGRKYFDNLNVQHENKQAMDIANSALKELLIAAGIVNVPFKRTDQLHNIPVKLKVSMGKPRDNGEEQNSVRYKPRVEVAGQIQRPAASAQKPTAPAPGEPKKKPWEK